MVDLGEGDNGVTWVEGENSGTTVTVFSSENIYDEEEGSLFELIALLKTIQRKIPEQYRASGRYQLSVSDNDYGGSSYATFEVTYERPATEKEITAEKLKQAANKAAADAHEFMQYQQLKQRFGG
jgi:hypothetical protein